MRRSFFPRLINGPFDDPGLFIQFFFEKRAVVFDLGDIYSLSPKDILKISHVFVTHTHMDHFVGFDRMLRLFLGRDQKLFLYGPEGFIKNVEARLGGYSWNLVKHYTNSLILHITEVRQDHLLSNIYPCQDGFQPASKAVEQPFNGTLHQEPAMTVFAEILDHSIPCLGFAIKERFHINIIKDRLKRLGLEIGPWLNEFKQALFSNEDRNSKFVVGDDKNSIKKKFVLGDLADQIAIITPGQKVAYVVDAIYNQSNIDKMIKLAKNADQLFIEAAFLEKDKNIAEKKCHLTARQAGSIAGKAQVKQFTPFHFSPRYMGLEELLGEEARTAYEKVIQKM